MSDKVHAGQVSKSSKELFRDGFKAFKEALKGAEGAFSHNSSLQLQASELLGQTAPSLAELPKILFQLSQSTSVGAVITSPTGSELMANNAFYNLTRSGGGAGGAQPSSTTAIKLRKGADGDEVTAPWARAPKSKKAIFERLYCGEAGASNGLYLDFYCQPLLGAGGEFEGAFTLVSDSSLEVLQQEKLRELIEGVEGHVDNLKQAADDLIHFLRSDGQVALPTAPAAEAPPVALKEAESAAADARPATAEYAAADGEAPAASQAASRPEATASREAAFAQDTAMAPAQSFGPDLAIVPEAPAAEAVVAEAPAAPPADAPRAHDPILDLLAKAAAVEEPDFDPADLQKAVESASAFILDHEAAAFPEAPDDEGPEELWQEMSDGLAEVLSVDESPTASMQDLNMTILEAKPPKVRTIHADKNNQPVFRDESGDAIVCLVVDDIPVNQKLLVFQLKHFGMSIDTASSGTEALDLIAKNNYQIVFMDCDMPVMNGFDTTNEIRRRELGGSTKLPIIGMTSHDREGDKQKCLRAGMNDALPKGVNESELRKSIATALGVVEVVKNSDGHESERNIDPQELEELISTFLYAMEMFVSSMQRAIDEKDSSLVRELANSVNGPSRVLGLHDMNKVSQEMVRLSSSGDWPQVRLKYLKLKTVYMRCQDDLRKLCPQAFSQVSATH